MAPLVAARRLVEKVARENPASLTLACLASFAVRVDPSLLRRLRLEFLPESSPALEADVWNGNLVSFRGPEGFVFAPGVGPILRERLAAVDPARYEQAWSITRQVHQSWLSPALCLEEELNYLQSSPTPGAYGRARELMRSAVSALVRKQSAGLAQWAAGAMTRLPSDLMDMEEGRMLAMAARTRLQGSLLLPAPPSGPMPEWMTWLAPEGMERIPIGVKLFPQAVEFEARPGSHAETIPLPRTNPLVVEVADEDEKTRWRRVNIPSSGTVRIPLTSHALRLRTLLGDEYVIQPAGPVGLHRVPPPEPGPVAHPRALDILWKVSERAPLVAISGPEGVGKTQLVRQFLAERVSAFPQGCFFIAVHSSGKPPSARTIARDVVQAFTPERMASSQDALQSYYTLMSERRMALVLEDVDALPWARQLASELNALRLSPEGSLLLVTSRERLEGLEAPQLELQPLESGNAVEMLMQLAPLSSEQAGEISDALHYLATPLREVGVAISKFGSDDDITHYASLLRQAPVLAVFPASFDLLAAEDVLAGEAPPAEESPSAVTRTSSALQMVNTGLLKSAEPGRYMLWWPIRQVAKARHGESAPEHVSLRHATYFLNLLARLSPQYMRGGRARAEAIATFDTESVNIVLAVEWLIPRVRDPEVMHLLGILTEASPLIRLRRPPRERERWFEELSKYFKELWLEYMIAQEDLGQQEVRTTQASTANPGDVRFEVDVRLGLATAAAERNELVRAAALCEEALEFARAWRDDRGVALASWELGKVRARQGTHERAGELLQVLVDYYRAIGHAKAEQVAREREQILRPSTLDERQLHQDAQVQEAAPAQTLEKDDSIASETPPPASNPLASPEAFRDLTNRISMALQSRLKCDDDTAYDAAIDVIFAYISQPDRHDPNKGSLESYLIQAAEHRVIDTHRAMARRTRLEQDFTHISETQFKDSKEEMETSVEARVSLDALIAHGYLKDEKDMDALRLLLQGESSTERLAKALWLDALPKEQMQREVRRHRDRLMKLLARFGEEN